MCVRNTIKSPCGFSARDATAKARLGMESRYCVTAFHQLAMTARLSKFFKLLVNPRPPHVMDFILTIPKCSRCSSVNTWFGKFFGMITLIPHIKQDLSTVNSLRLFQYGFSLSFTSFGQFFRVYYQTLLKIGSERVACPSCREVTGSKST